ncbi:MAG: leucine-rich repeat protein, partial [Lachnospiraceae bacterium]|nr:leucine-rich repeat protein [Lachnospiraceae bacterium]
MRGNAFDYCKNIEELTIPDTVEEIGKFVICQFNNMTQIHFPNSLKIFTPKMIRECKKISE